MIWTPKNSKDFKLVDKMGKHITYAHKFNDETFEAEIYLTNAEGEFIVSDDGVVSVTAHIPGAKIVTK